jgi:sulfur-carrier protein adenylyltransferase/sulfurtransferase
MNEERYSKQIKLKGFGLPAQQCLQNSKVLIVGAGGLGTPCAQYLNGVGVGTIGLIDNDTISLSNLPRQTLFDESEIGMSKVAVLVQKLRKQNPAAHFICYNEFLTPANAIAIISGYDVVVDASDNFGTRYLVNDACVILNKPFVYGALHAYEGQVSVLNYQHGPTYRCLFPETEKPNNIPNCDDNGILGVLPALIGTYQAIEAIKIITGTGNPLSGQLLIIDTLTQSHFKIGVAANPENLKISQLRASYAVPECDTGVKSIDAAELKTWQQAGKKINLIDVRTAIEFSKAQLPFSKNIPLDDLLVRQSEIDFSLPVVTICQTGSRSKAAALYLIKATNAERIFNLQGGLESIL